MKSHSILIVVACINTWLVSAGVIYGWSALHDLLVRENQFPDHQESHLQTIFTTAFIFLSVATMVYGVTLDSFGPRFTTLAGIFLFFIGNIMMALSDYKKLNMFIPAFSLIGAGGIAPFLCHFNFANVFENAGKSKALYISIINGIFNVSGFNYLLIPALNLSRKEFFLIYACIAVLAFIACALTYPDKILLPGDKITLPIMKILKRRCGEEEEEVDGAALLLKQEVPKSNEEGVDEKREWDHQMQLVKETMYTRRFLMLVYWYSFALLTISSTTASIPDILSKYSNRPIVNHHDLYSSIISPILSNVAFIFAPLSGVLISMKWGGFPLAFAVVNVSTLFVLSFSILPTSWGIEVQLVTLIAQAAQKGILFNTFYSFLAIKFPMEINGTLISIVTLCSSIIGTFNYLLVFLTQDVFHGSYVPVNCALIVLILPSLLMSFFSKNSTADIKLIRDDESVEESSSSAHHI